MFALFYILPSISILSCQCFTKVYANNYSLNIYLLRLLPYACFTLWCTVKHGKYLTLMLSTVFEHKFLSTDGSQYYLVLLLFYYWYDFVKKTSYSTGCNCINHLHWLTSYGHKQKLQNTNKQNHSSILNKRNSVLLFCFHLYLFCFHLY